MVSGQEVRIGQFLAPKVAFQVDQAVQTALEMEVLINFFHARRGRLQGFLALDYTDFQAVNEFFGSGDGITTVWQLVKHYFSEAFAQVRSITHLASAVVAIFQDGMLMTNVRVVTTESGMDVLPGDPTLILPRAT